MSNAFISSSLGFSHPIVLNGLSLNFQGIIEVFPFIFLALGILYSFFGKEIFDILNFTIGGAISAGFVYFNGLAIGPGMYFLLILTFLISGAVAYFAPYLLVSVIGFVFGAGLLFSYSGFLAVIFGIIIAAAAIFLLRFLLPVVTALVGGLLGGIAAFVLFGFPEAFFITTFCLSIGGTIFQLLRADSTFKPSSEK